MQTGLYNREKENMRSLDRIVAGLLVAKYVLVSAHPQGFNADLPTTVASDLATAGRQLEAIAENAKLIALEAVVTSKNNATCTKPRLIRKRNWYVVACLDTITTQ